MTESKADIGAVERSGATDGTTKTKADIGAVERAEAGGGGAATRGMPFGNRSTAFNGGRTFQGILS